MSAGFAALKSWLDMVQRFVVVESLEAYRIATRPTIRFIGPLERKKRRDQRVFRAANRTPLISLRLPRLPARALVTRGISLAHRMGGGLPSVAWRRRSGYATSLISFRLLRLRLHATKQPTEAP